MKILRFLYLDWRLFLFGSNANNTEKDGSFAVNANNSKKMFKLIKIFCIFTIVGIVTDSFCNERVRIEPFPTSYTSIHNLKIYTMKKEIWKSINGYEKIYKISNIGSIKNIKTNRILKSGINGCGYKLISLCDGRCKSFKVHLLVFDAFGIGKRNGHIIQIDHKDNNKLNNCIENLQLLSNRENTSKYQSTQERSSKYVGVYWHKKAKKWLVQIRIGNIRKYLGLFESEQKAHLKYQNELINITH